MMFRKKKVYKEIREIIFIQPNKQTLASFVIGCIGAAMGGFYGYLAFLEDSEGYKPIIPAYFVFIVGLTSGFLSCFYCSKIYLKLLEDKDRRYGIRLAPTFGAIAGAITGFLTGFSWYPFAAPFGIIVGGSIGLVIGIVSWLMFGKLALCFLAK